MARVRGADDQDCARFAGNRVRGHHLWVALHRRPHLVSCHRPFAEEEDDGLHRPPELLGIEHCRITGDDSSRFEPVDAPFDRWRRESDGLADLAKGLARSGPKTRNDLPVDLIEERASRAHDATKRGCV